MNEKPTTSQQKALEAAAEFLDLWEANVSMAARGGTGELTTPIERAGS